jgi:hypothetical protein
VGHVTASEHDNHHERHGHPGDDGANLSHFRTPCLSLYAAAGPLVFVQCWEPSRGTYMTQVNV